MPSRVVVSSNGNSARRVLVDRVHSVVSNRCHDGEEQYLIRWHMATETETETETPPLSWHPIKELVRCLEYVQDYVDARQSRTGSATALRNIAEDNNDNSGNDDRGITKRKRLDGNREIERRPSPFERQLQGDERRYASIPTSRSSSVELNLPPLSSYSVYNGVLHVNSDGFLFCQSQQNSDIATLTLHETSSPCMVLRAQQANVHTALCLIRNTYVRRLKRVPGRPIHLINIVDSSTPSLRFRYIPDCILDEQQGVYRASPETQQGCTECLPNMGRSIGCEYTKKCDCLEYAAVDETRITTDSQWEAYHQALSKGESTLGFPKKFPYFAKGTKREKPGCLVPFYLHSRRPIYECNDRCHCGPECRNKNVQHGRQVELEIFRTAGGRGWGLKCTEDLHMGQFVDTYRGEIITDVEATFREEASSTKAKASYLYSLDKFQESENIKNEDIFVVDGEFMGGPTKFMNHSCDPNCRQYTVSYNRHDPRVYDIAFFACRFIPAGEELTFDYLDKDEEENEPSELPGEGAVPCLCGASNCRKWLWT